MLIGSESPPATLSQSSEISSSEDSDMAGMDAKLEKFAIDTSNRMNHQPSSLERHYKMLGNVFARSEDSGPDWALIKLTTLSRAFPNKISVFLHNKEGTNYKKLHIFPEKVASCIIDNDIFIATARAGTIKGYISATPTFIRLAGCPKFLKVWPVTSEEALGEFLLPTIELRY